MHIPYTSSDMWLFAAIAYSTANGPAELADIIGTGDAINKAIFTDQELRRGMARLTSGGLVADLGGRYDLTEAGRKLLDQVRTRRVRTPSELWTRLDKVLSTDRGARNHPQYEDPAWPYPSLTETAIAEATASYREKATKVMKELGPQVENE